MGGAGGTVRRVTTRDGARAVVVVLGRVVVLLDVGAPTCGPGRFSARRRELLGCPCCGCLPGSSLPSGRGPCGSLGASLPSGRFACGRLGTSPLPGGHPRLFRDDEGLQLALHPFMQLSLLVDRGGRSLTLLLDEGPGLVRLLLGPSQPRHHRRTVRLCSAKRGDEIGLVADCGRRVSHADREIRAARLEQGVQLVQAAAVYALTA